MTKAPTTTKNPKKQRVNTKKPSKTSNTQRFRTDLGRSVGKTTATPLVWLNAQLTLRLIPFAGVRECPPWCSFVGATVTVWVHQFFCILHFTRNVGELAEWYRRLAFKLEDVPSLGLESYLGQDFSVMFTCSVFLSVFPAGLAAFK